MIKNQVSEIASQIVSDYKSQGWSGGITSHGLTECDVDFIVSEFERRNLDYHEDWLSYIETMVGDILNFAPRS